MISSGVGMDAIVCKNTITSRAKKVLNKIGLGKLTYLVITVQSLFSMETADVNVDFDGKESSMKKMIFTAAMNVRTEGGGVPMAPNADVRDGKLSFCSIHGIPKWKTFFYLPLLVMAKHEKIKGVGITDCQNARLKSHTPMVLHTDGEYLGDVFDVEYICHSRKLTFVKYY